MKKFWNVLGTVLVILVVLFAAALVGVRLFGFKPYAVLSPSMTPTYLPGDLIYVLPTEPENIEVGDAITFMGGEDIIVTHRVYDVDRHARTFITKGDANKDTDPPVLYENVIGVVRFSLPKLGYVSDFIGTPSGRWAAGGALAAVVLVLIIPEFFKKDKKGKEPPANTKG